MQWRHWRGLFVAAIIEELYVRIVGTFSGQVYWLRLQVTNRDYSWRMAWPRYETEVGDNRGVALYMYNVHTGTRARVKGFCAKSTPREESDLICRWVPWTISLVISLTILTQNDNFHVAPQSNFIQIGPGCYVMKGFACQKVCRKIFNIMYCFVPKIKSTP